MDDERETLDLVTMFIKNSFPSCHVMVALDGQDALEKIEEEGIPDVVFTDLLMPRMDGVEFCKKLKELDPGLPVILLTALDDHSTIFDGLVSKPFTHVDIIDNIKKLGSRGN
ncbi:MAG: response regulator [Candidatus Hodarchaeota archaeon]